MLAVPRVAVPCAVVVVDEVDSVIAAAVAASLREVAHGVASATVVGADEAALAPAEVLQGAVASLLVAVAVEATERARIK